MKIFAVLFLSLFTIALHGAQTAFTSFVGTNGITITTPGTGANQKVLIGNTGSTPPPPPPAVVGLWYQDTNGVYRPTSTNAFRIHPNGTVYVGTNTDSYFVTVPQGTIFGVRSTGRGEANFNEILIGVENSTDGSVTNQAVFDSFGDVDSWVTYQVVDTNGVTASIIDLVTEATGSYIDIKNGTTTIFKTPLTNAVAGQVFTSDGVGTGYWGPGGTTINSLDGFIPVRGNATTFTNSQFVIRGSETWLTNFYSALSAQLFFMRSNDASSKLIVGSIPAGGKVISSGTMSLESVQNATLGLAEGTNTLFLIAKTFYPNLSNDVSLGTSIQPWKDLYLGTGSLHFIFPGNDVAYSDNGTALTRNGVAVGGGGIVPPWTNIAGVLQPNGVGENTNGVKISPDGGVGIGPNSTAPTGGTAIFSKRDTSLGEDGFNEIVLFVVGADGPSDNRTSVDTYLSATDTDQIWSSKFAGLNNHVKVGTDTDVAFVEIEIGGIQRMLLASALPASTTPYTFDTSLFHTSGNLVEVKNFGTNKFDVWWNGMASNAVGYAFPDGTVQTTAASSAFIATLNGLGTNTALYGDVLVPNTLKVGTNTAIAVSNILDVVSTIAAGRHSLTVNTNGNVGIGVMTPGYLLDIYGASTVGSLAVRSGNNYSELRIEGGVAGDVGWLLRSGYPNAGDLTIRESGVGDYLNIKKTSGNVGIGTTVPTAKLHVNSINDPVFKISSTAGTNIVSVGTNGVLTVTNGIASYANNVTAPIAITFPASTVNWTNTTSTIIELYIDNVGITGTAIFKNGGQILGGLITGYTMLLQPGAYFSQTYSVGTPTAKYSPF